MKSERSEDETSKPIVTIIFVDSDDGEEKKYHVQKYRDAGFAFFEELINPVASSNSVFILL